MAVIFVEFSSQLVRVRFRSEVEADTMPPPLPLIVALEVDVNLHGRLLAIQVGSR